MNTATAGVWQSETSKMRSRGKLIIIQMAVSLPCPESARLYGLVDSLDLVHCFDGIC